MIRKFISEFVGTCLLVVFGCGSAVALNQYATNTTGLTLPFTLLSIAFAFGLVLMVLVYTIGRVSGCHVNPAVSVAALIDGRITLFECIYYVCAQLLGGIMGAFILSLIFGSYSSLGANGYAELSALQNITTVQVAFGIEVLLTFTFVLVVLAASKKESPTTGLVIGLALTLVHIMGIPFTGTSVNPARSIGPAILTGETALNQLWVFILAPLVGGILAALFYRFVIRAHEESLENVPVSHIDYEDDEDDEDEEDDKPRKKTNNSKKGN